ncbi:MAG: efflux RND transporter periplasmic adaptor subunit [Pseudomonadota bacterium]
MRRIPPLLLLPVAATLLLAGCGGESAGAPRGPAPAVGVVAVVVERRPWSDAIEALGTAYARESVVLTAKVTETVSRINFRDGDTVEAGQVLVELTGRAEAAQLEEARAAAREAQQQYARQSDLVKQGTIARSQLDAQIALRDAAVARMNTIRARLADRVITAPFAGVLGFRRVSEGTLVAPGTEITTLDDISLMKIDFSVPEAALSAMRTGLPVRATSVAWPGRTFEGSVVSIGSRVDPVSRAVTVRAEVPNPESLLKPGMLLGVAIDSAPREALVIPEIALVSVGSRHYVYAVAEGDVARQVEVGIGSRRAGEVEIVRGLEPGQRVVTDGIVKLRDGAKVAVAAPTPAAA